MTVAELRALLDEEPHTGWYAVERRQVVALLELADAALRLREEKAKVVEAAKRGELLGTGALSAADEALFSALSKLT